MAMLMAELPPRAVPTTDSC